MKIDRLVSIIMILLKEPKVSAQNLADRFEVSLRTIYRDIDAICMAGIPVQATSGVGGGFEIMPQYKVDQNVFSPSELSSLLMGLSCLEKLSDNDEMIRTVSKIKNLIPKEQDRKVELSVRQIRFDFDPWSPNFGIKEKLEVIKKSFASHNRISFGYVSQKSRPHHRTVEPCQLIFKNGQWYLYAYCKYKKDFRIFKLNRMSDLKLEKTIFVPSDFPPAELNAAEIIEPLTFNVKLRIRNHLLERILDFCPSKNITRDGKDFYLVDFPFIDRDFYYDLLLGFGDGCECLGPENVREKLKFKIQNLQQLYRL